MLLNITCSQIKIRIKHYECGIVVRVNLGRFLETRKIGKVWPVSNFNPTDIRKISEILVNFDL